MVGTMDNIGPMMLKRITNSSYNESRATDEKYCELLYHLIYINKSLLKYVQMKYGFITFSK